MGIESVNGVSSYQASSKINSVKAAKAVESVDVSRQAADTAAGQAAAGKVVRVPENAKQKFSDAEGEETNSNQDKNPTMKEVKQINKILNHNTIAEFGYNEPTNRITIKIKDKDTDEVIREIPSEKALEMLAKAWELAGILVDEKR